MCAKLYKNIDDSTCYTPDCHGAANVAVSIAPSQTGTDAYRRSLSCIGKIPQTVAKHYLPAVQDHAGEIVWNPVRHTVRVPRGAESGQFQWSPY